VLAWFSERKFDAKPALRDDILRFYCDLAVSVRHKKGQGPLASRASHTGQLKLMIPVPPLAASAREMTAKSKFRCVHN
jgi:hypothetical protein